MRNSTGASVVAPKYTRSSIKSPCPVCGRTKDKDCSLHPDGKTAHCKTYVSGIGHDESQWHYQGVNKHGFQGIFVLKQVEPEFVKSPRAKGKKYYYYPNRDGGSLVRVERIDYGNGKKKDFYQSYWDGSNWVNKNPDEVKLLIPIYRCAEVRKAIARGELVFIVEGEGVADLLWKLGIAATTTIGGSGGYANYGNYRDDLKGARLVLVPDRDDMGIKYMSNFDRDFATQIEGWYLAGTVGLWKHPQGGMDIGDDLLDHKYTKEQILAKVIIPEECQEILVSQVEKEDENLELAQGLKSSLELKNGKAPNVFGGRLGCLLSIAASNFNIPTDILTFCLLPIFASQIDSKTELLINPGTDYRVPAVRWCGLVGDTGSKKSPVLGILTKPLSIRQSELYADYKANKLAYEAEFRSWKASKAKEKGEEPELPAPLKDLYFSDFTIEGIILSLSYYPDDAYLLMLDELAAFFSAMDAYRGGKGGDRQKWLTIWNGGAIKVNRKSSDTICIPQSSISILGGIQPQTIANLIGGDASQQDGLWNRFSFMGLPHNLTEAFTETPGDLKVALDRVYRALSNQASQTHSLSLEAKPLWKAWHDEIEAKAISESNWLVKGTYAKFEGIAGRNALIIHRALAAIEGYEPTQLVSAEVLELAIAWTKFELNQTLSQYQILAIDDTNPEQVRMLKFIDKFKGQEWVTTRMVTHWWSGRVKPPSKDLRVFMSKVVALGYAVANDRPIDCSEYQIKILKDGSNSSNSSNKPPESETQQQKSLLLPLVTSFTPINTNIVDIASFDAVTTSIKDGSNNQIKNETDRNNNGGVNENSNNGTNNGSNNPKPLVISNLVEEGEKVVTKGSNNEKPAQGSNSSHLVTTVTTVTTSKSKKTPIIGDLLHYTGTQKNLIQQYAGDLVAYEFSKSMGEVTCLKPDGKLTSWIDLSDLKKIA